MPLCFLPKKRNEGFCENGKIDSRARLSDSSPRSQSGKGGMVLRKEGVYLLDELVPVGVKGQKGLLRYACRRK